MPRNVNCKYYAKFANCNHESRKILGFKRSCVKVTDIFAVCDLLETKENMGLFQQKQKDPIKKKISLKIAKRKLKLQG